MNEVTVLRQGLRCDKCKFESDGAMHPKCPDCNSNLFVRSYRIDLKRGARLRSTKTNKIGIYTGDTLDSSPPYFIVKYENGTYGQIHASHCMLIEEDDK